MIKRPLFILRLATFFLLLGRGWQFVFYDTPFHRWLDSSSPTPWMIPAIGVFWLICATLAGVVKPGEKLLYGLLIISSLLLMAMTFALWQGSSYQFAQLIEQTAQWATPLLLIYALMSASMNHSGAGPSVEKLILVTTALVFTGHGLYASGIFPQPANFHYMVTSILGISGVSASWFLRVAGIMDFVVSAAIFIPRLRRVGLAYMAVWGLLTALARVIAYVELTDLGATLFEWLPQVLFRLPHGLLPLVVLKKIFSEKKIMT
ncbi:MAG: hypothetical protein SF052_14200 [Bacteroidia bacterium]|nr:hypothetical protein [Bacteroidia bacterium]